MTVLTELPCIIYAVLHDSECQMGSVMGYLNRLAESKDAFLEGLYLAVDEWRYT